jgi:ribose transport system permease protein
MSNQNENQPVAATGETTMLVGARKLTPQTFVLKYNALIMLLILIFISAFMSPIFLTHMNLVNVLRQQTGYLITAMGLLVCMMAGGIDLSLAATVGFGCIMTTEFVVVHGTPIIPAIILTLLLCAVIGALNGSLVAYLGMPPFIVTLSMSFAVTGVVFWLTRGNNRVLAGADPLIRTFRVFGQDNDPILGLPWRFYLTLVIILVVWFVLKYTAFGRLATATGSNPVAATLAGIDIRKYKLIGHIVCSTTAGLTGVLIVAATNSSAPSLVNGDYTMVAIAATIIGGSDLGGGKGSVPFSVVGIFIMGLIGNIMNLSNISFYPQFVIRAVVILLAIFMRSVIDTRRMR